MKRLMSNQFARDVTSLESAALERIEALCLDTDYRDVADRVTGLIIGTFSMEKY